MLPRWGAAQLSSISLPIRLTRIVWTKRTSSSESGLDTPTIEDLPSAIQIPRENANNPVTKPNIPAIPSNAKSISNEIREGVAKYHDETTKIQPIPVDNGFETP